MNRIQYVSGENAQGRQVGHKASGTVVCEPVQVVSSNYELFISK